MLDLGRFLEDHTDPWLLLGPDGEQVPLGNGPAVRGRPAGGGGGPTSFSTNPLDGTWPVVSVQ